MKELFEKHDKELEEILYGQQVPEFESVSVVTNFLSERDDKIVSHISKIRQETLQAVREELDKWTEENELPHIPNDLLKQ